MITGNPPYERCIGFEGRPEQVNVSWYKNGNVLSEESAAQIQTIATGELKANACLQFVNISRSDSAVYRVVIEGKFDSDVIPDDVNFIERSFQVEIFGKISAE